MTGPSGSQIHALRCLAGWMIICRGKECGVQQCSQKETWRKRHLNQNLWVKQPLSLVRSANILRCFEISQPTLFFTATLRCESLWQLAYQVGPSTHRLAVGELFLWQPAFFDSFQHRQGNRWSWGLDLLVIDWPSRLLLASIRMAEFGHFFGGGTGASKSQGQPKKKGWCCWRHGVGNIEKIWQSTCAMQMQDHANPLGPMQFQCCWWCRRNAVV